MSMWERERETMESKHVNSRQCLKLCPVSPGKGGSMPGPCAVRQSTTVSLLWVSRVGGMVLCNNQKILECYPPLQ